MNALIETTRLARRFIYYSGHRFSEDIDFSCIPAQARLASATALLSRAVRAFEDASGLSVALREAKASEGVGLAILPKAIEVHYCVLSPVQRSSRIAGRSTEKGSDVT